MITEIFETFVNNLPGVTVPLSGNETFYVLQNGVSSAINSTALFQNVPINVNIGNTTANLFANSTDLTIANSTSSLVGNPLTLSIGNSTVNAAVNSTQYSVSNSITSTVLTSLTIQVGNSISNALINSVHITVGNSISNVSMNSSNFFIGNSTANGYSNSSVEIIANTSGQTVITAITFSVGNSTANAFGNSIYDTIANSTANVQLQPGLLTLQGTGSNAGLTVGTSVKAVNGYTFIPNGLMLQWFTANANSTATSITFPTAFPTSVYSVQITGNNGGVNTATISTAANTTKIGVTAPTVANIAYNFLMIGS